MKNNEADDARKNETYKNKILTVPNVLSAFRLFFGFFTHALKRTDIPHHIQQERKAHHRRADDYQRVRQRRSNIIEHNMCNHQRV